MTEENQTTAPQVRLARVGEAQILTELAMRSKAQWNYSAEQLAMWRGELTVPPELIFAGNMWVGVIEDQIVAMMALIPAVMTWKLDFFFVAPDHMNQGVGAHMFQHAVDQARAGRARAIAVDADPNAERFYLSCGAIRSYVKAAAIADDSTRIRPQMLYLIRHKNII